MITLTAHRPLRLVGLLMFLLAAPAGSGHAGVTHYTSSWSRSVTVKTYSKSTHRKVPSSHTPGRRSSRASVCPLRPSAEDSVVRKVGSGRNDNNCVLFLRNQRGVNLPHKNLTTYASKLSIINSHIPRENSVAVIKTPGRNAGIGHLAEVTGLEENNGKVTMHLLEANNPKRGYFERTITGENLREIQRKANIVGYYTEPHETMKAQNSDNARYF